MTYLPKGAPRLRVNRDTDIALTTSWQRVYFDGSSSLNMNTYPTVDSEKVCWWDNANGVFQFNHPELERNYLFTMYVESEASIINIRAMLRYRFVIPNGISPGVNFYFPFPDNQSEAYADLGEITAFNNVRHGLESQPIYTNSAILNNGLGIEFKLSNSIAIGANPKILQITALINSTSMNA